VSLADFVDCDTGRTYPGQTLYWLGGAGTTRLETVLPQFSDQTNSVYLLLTTAAPAKLMLFEMLMQQDEADEDRLLSIVQASANELVVQTDMLPEKRHLLFTESCYPGWSVSVDGKPAPLQQAYGVFQSVALQPGTHRIVFSYHPTRITIGLAIAGAALGLALLVLVLTRRSGGARAR
jgi:hypothetical protein